MPRIKKPTATGKRLNLPLKICNICGSDTVEYQVIDNAPICFNCVPKQELKIIPNENKMLNSILNKK